MKKKKVYISMLTTFLVVSGIFIALFVLRDKGFVLPTASVFDRNAPPQYSQMIYGGFGEEALNKPMDVAEINQFVYITDTNNKRVQVFDIAGTPIFKFGKEGEGPGEFKFPYGIDGDSEGNIYVSDLYNGCISIHDSKGNFLSYFAEKDSKEKVIEAPGSFRIVDDQVYVTDIKKSKVLIFDIEGNLLKEIGQPGTEQGQFRAPNAITVDKDKNIYVVDTGNQRIQVFDKDGNFLRIINGSADGGTSVLVNPRGIAIDSRGIIHVVSNLTHFVYGFDSEGKQVFTFGGNGESLTQFSLPNGLYITEDDTVYITDSANQRVAVYK